MEYKKAFFFLVLVIVCVKYSPDSKELLTEIIRFNNNLKTIIELLKVLEVDSLLFLKNRNESKHGNCERSLRSFC